jgi:hypothetical protein
MELQLDKSGKFIQNLLRYYFLTGAFEGGIVFTLLLLIPRDLKNIWRFGYSKSRLILFVGLALFISVFIWFVIKSYRDTGWFKSLGSRLEIQVAEYGWFFPIALILFGILVLGPYTYLLIAHPWDGIILRIMPMIFLVTIRIIQTLLTICVIKIRERKTDKNLNRYKNNLLDDTFILSINTKKVVVILGTICVLLIMANISANLLELVVSDPKLFRITNKLSLDQEINIPTYFSTLLLFLSAILLAVIARLQKNQTGTDPFHWGLLSIIFLYLSVDETAGLHELFNKPVQRNLNPRGIFENGWVIIAIPLVIFLGLVYIKFLSHLARKTRFQFLLAGGIYIAGAIGFELLGAGYVSQHGIDNLTYAMIATLEESFEMAGAILFIAALLDYLALTFGGQHILIQSKGSIQKF